MAEKHLEVWKRDYGNQTRVSCECGCIVDKAAYRQETSSFTWDIDHVWPLSREGADTIANMQVLCTHCNRVSKANHLHGIFGPYGTTGFSVEQAGRTKNNKIIGRMSTWDVEDEDDDYDE